MTKGCRRFVASVLVASAVVYGGLGAAYLYLLGERARMAQPATAAEYAAMNAARAGRR
jgi:phosphopantothenate synthetase